MLFILVMDVLNSLVMKAIEQGLLQPLLRRGGAKRISLYADDVVLYLKPCVEELNLLKEILRTFGVAAGLVTNISKCSVTPMHCKEQDLSTEQELLPCIVVHFPCNYLGLPLSVRKITKADIISLIGKIADRLPGWKAALIHLLA
jgi:hypothetical protein